MTYGQDAVYGDRDQAFHPPFRCTVVSPTKNVVARYGTHPHLVQFSVLLNLEQSCMAQAPFA